MDKNTEVLNEINAVSRVSIMAIGELRKKALRENMIKELNDQELYYYKVKQESKKMLNDQEPHLNDASLCMQKVMMRAKLALNNTPQDITETLIKGTNTGVISVLKRYNRNKCCISEDVDSLAQDVIETLNGYISNLKNLL